MKPLNQKCYGSIAHLDSTSNTRGDHCISEGQARIATVKSRDSHDIIIIQEKLDGFNAGVAKINGRLVALTRSGNLCCQSRFPQHRKFDTWVWQHYDRFNSLLQEGERIVGEGLWLAHGTRYYPERVLGWEPWVAFDIMTGATRVPYNTFLSRVAPVFKIPPLISIGPPHTIEWVTEECPKSRYGGEHVEGWVYRIERNKYAKNGPYVDFLSKWVKPDYIAGRYLPEFSGMPPVWNYGGPGTR